MHFIMYGALGWDSRSRFASLKNSSIVGEIMPLFT